MRTFVELEVVGEEQRATARADMMQVSWSH